MVTAFIAGDVSLLIPFQNKDICMVSDYLLGFFKQVYIQFLNILFVQLCRTLCQIISETIVCV